MANILSPLTSSWRTVKASNPDSFAFFNSCSPGAALDLRYYTGCPPYQTLSVSNQLYNHFNNVVLYPSVFSKEMVSLSVTYATLLSGGAYAKS